MLTDALKTYTKNAHLSVERLIIQKIQSLQTAEDYAELLQLFYGYFGALEDKINAVIHLQKLPDYNERRKTNALLSDINSLNTKTNAAEKANDLPSLQTHSEALGALYVIEGSTLGGQIIKKMISQKLGSDHANAYQFFNGYGDETSKKWASFKSALDDVSQSEEDKNLTLSAALETFEKFKKWIERYDRNKKL